MALSQDQLKKVENWLRSKAPAFKCTVCDGRNIAVEGPVMANSFENGNIGIGGPGIPFVLISCNNCGHLMPFSAVMMGIV